MVGKIFRRLNGMKKAVSILAVLMMSALPLSAEQTDARIKELALEAILENPEIIAEAIQILQERQQQEKPNHTCVSEMEERAKEARVFHVH